MTKQEQQNYNSLLKFAEDMATFLNEDHLKYAYSKEPTNDPRESFENGKNHNAGKVALMARDVLKELK